MDQGNMLLRLQEIDVEIRRAQKQLDELPIKGKIIETRHKIQEVEALKAKAEHLIAMLDRAVAKNEDETAQLSDKLESEQAKVMSGDITNPKEVQHITREMDSLRRRKEKLEMEDLELMERIEKARLQVGKIGVALEKLASAEATQTAEYRAAGGELQAALEKLNAQRAELTKALESEILVQYETICASKGGVGAGSLAGSACTACRMELPAQKVEKILAGPAITICPSCRRLLVIVPAIEEAE